MKDKAKIVKMGEFANDASRMSVLDALDSARAELESGETTATKLMVICLDDRDGMYKTQWFQAGMKASEMLSLLDIVRHNIIVNHMNL